MKVNKEPKLSTSTFLQDVKIISTLVDQFEEGLITEDEFVQGIRENKATMIALIDAVVVAPTSVNYKLWELEQYIEANKDEF